MIKSRLYFTPKLFTYLGLLMALLSLSFAFPVLWVPYLVGAFAFVVIVISDLPRGQPPVAVSYQVPDKVYLDESFTWDWRVSWSGVSRRWARELKIYSPHTQHLQFSQVSLLVDLRELVAKAGHGQEKVFSIQAHPKKLGREQVSELRIEAKSYWGLWYRHSTIAVMGSEYQVSPSVKEVGVDRFRQIIGDQNFFKVSRRSQMRRQDMDFLHTIRDYAFPDPLRFIDARKSIRYGKPMTKVFESSFNQQLIIVLDCGRNLAGHLGRSQKLDFYLSLVLALAEQALAKGDQVSFFALSDQVQMRIVDSRDLRDFRPVRGALSSFHARDVETDYFQLSEIYAKTARQKGVFVFLTDFFRPSVQTRFLEILPSINRKHLVLLASLLDEEYLLENQLERFNESSTLDAQQYARLLVGYDLAQEARSFRTRINAQKAGWVAASEKEWMSVVPKAYALLRESLRT